MKELVAAFPDHLNEALEIAESIQIQSRSMEISEVVVLGMGGSGIGGTITREVVQDELSVPLISCKDYTIPGFISKRTLIIASSYSGNTEETLSALEKASEKTGQFLCITSGGKLKDWAEKRGCGIVLIPGGIPPRAAFGYSFPQILALLNASELLDIDLRKAIEPVVDLLKSNSEEIRKQALEIAEIVRDKTIVLYAQSDFEGVCVRFRQQLNENSKKLCWHHVIPELNHNELVGWRDERKDLAVVFLRNVTDAPRNQLRMQLTKDIVAKYSATIVEINSIGNTKLARTLYLIHLCDWISVLVAELNDVDPVEIDVINFLKTELARK